MSFLLRQGSSLCILALASVAGPAFAQTVPPATQPSASGGLTDIVVTAEKRETFAQRTPIALDVFSPEKLAQNGVKDVISLQNIAPTLQFTLSGADTLVALRGVSSRDYTEIGDPAVAISIDNFYLQRSVALNASMFDVERVEVLRGPQGTLYGRNATGGAINISSVKPVLGSYKGYGSIEYGNYNTVKAEGAVNVPLADNLALRAAFFRSTHDGYSKITGEANGDDDDTTGARLHLLYKPTPRLKLLLTGEYTKLGGVGPIAYGQPYVYTASGAISHQDVNIASRDHWSLNTAGSISTTTKTVRGEASYDLDFMTVSYFGGYRKMMYARSNDIDGTAMTTNAGYLTYPQNENEGTQNHELRFTSQGNSRLTWQAGLYYFRERNTLYSIYGYDNVVPFVPTYIFSYKVGANSKAAFAQLGYKIAPGLKLEGGLRYSEDEKFRTGFQSVSEAITNDNSYTKNSKVTWHGAVTYEPTRSNLLYAKVDTGYKSGGFTSVSRYGPESLTAYEVGSKNRFAGNRVEFNIDGFYYDYRDLQVSQYRADGLSSITNAGKARIWGIETEAAFMPTPADRLNLTVNYLDAKYVDFSVASGGTNVSYNGNTMIQAPKWSIAGGAQHRFDLPGGALTVRVQSRFQTRSYFSYRDYNSESQKSFSKTDLNLEYKPNGLRVEFMLYLRNIEGQRIMLGATEYGAASVYRFQFAEPRTYGGRMTYKF